MKSENCLKPSQFNSLSLSSWWKHIPVSINNAFGDPLIDIQFDDTLMKLIALQYNESPYSLCTKAVPSDRVLNKLKELPKTNKLFLQYSLTGLNEGGFSFEQRVNSIEKLYNIFGDIAIMVRPLIKGVNDNIENLRRIVEVAKNTGKSIIMGGIHNEFKRKQVDENVKNMLMELCYKSNVKFFNKTSCAAANHTNVKCWVHDLSRPINLEVLNILGYDYSIINDVVCLNQATVGDLNFLRMITKSNVITKKLVSGYNILSISTSKYKFECTSSWYSWSRNTACSLACDYCIINSIEYLSDFCDIGQNPAEILMYSKPARETTNENVWEGGEYINDTQSKFTEYQNVRTIHECLSRAY